LHASEVEKEALDLVKKHMFDNEMCYDLRTEDKYRKDLVSHHILRLAFCNSEDKRRQFADAETTLFRARFLKLQADQKAFFMKQNNLSFELVGHGELVAHRDSLRQVYDAVGADEERAEGQRMTKDEEDQDFQRLTYCKVPFTQAIDLIRGRRIFVHEGMAFVPERRLVAIIVNRFKVYMKNALVVANKALPPLLADERINPILKSMADAYTGPDFGGKKGAAGDVRPENIESLSGTSFALCMQSMQDALKAKGKLMHDGRQQYGLFLKGIGLTLEDSLAFWQKQFSKTTSPEEFIKKYAYNIRCVGSRGRGRRRARWREEVRNRPVRVFRHSAFTRARTRRAPALARSRLTRTPSPPQAQLRQGGQAGRLHGDAVHAHHHGARARWGPNARVPFPALGRDAAARDSRAAAVCARRHRQDFKGAVGAQLPNRVPLAL
jgi:DNA primase large subunit